MIEHYTRTWNKARVLLIGYSQGADVLPFLVNRLPDAAHRRVAATVLIGVSTDRLFGPVIVFGEGGRALAPLDGPANARTARRAAQSAPSASMRCRLTGASGRA